MGISDKRNAMPVEQARALFSGITALSYDFGGFAGSGGHGTQIEYLAPDGSTYLWYPGNRNIVVGGWDVRRSGNKTQMCFRYGPNTYNPVTEESGGKWECIVLSNYMIFQIDRQKGDMFGLSESKAVPYRLDRDAAKPWAPRNLPVEMPFIVEGKSVLEHIRDRGPEPVAGVAG